MSQIHTAKAKASKEAAKDNSENSSAKAANKTLKVAPVARFEEPVRRVTPQLIQECRAKLLQVKTDLLNQAKEVRNDLTSDDKGGDEADQTVRVLAEAEFLNRHERLRSQLMEIEAALGRIENGSFGVCEETEEPIEPERLRAIPWTRLSIEGAEIRESMNKRFAR
jgi:DnaK suppressor protein